MPLENAQRFETANRKTRELIVLQETTLDIASELETDRILNSVLERATTLLNAMGGSIFLVVSNLHTTNNERYLKNEVCYGLDPAYANLTMPVGEGIAGRVAKSGKPQIERNYQNTLDQVALYAGKTFGSVVAVPITWKGKVTGVLELIHNNHGPKFDDSDAQLLSILANQTATALENARLIKEAHDTASQLTTLNEVNRIISATLDLDEALRQIMEVAVDILNTEAGSIFLVNQDREALTFEIAIGPRWR